MTTTNCMNNSMNNGIYTAIGVKNENAIQIKCLGILDDEKIKDTCISSYDIINNVKGYIYACNITDMFLLSNKTIPLIYVDVIYIKSIIVNILLNMTLYFEITSNITSEEQLLHEKIYGDFYIELQIFIPNHPIKQKILLNNLHPDKDLNQFPGNDEILNIFKEITKSNHITSYLNDIILKNEKLRIERFGGNYDFDHFKPTIV